MRARPYIKNGTLWSDCHQLLRGSTRILWSPTDEETLWAINPDSWQAAKNLKLNVVRLIVGLGRVGLTIEDQLSYIDQCVENAANAGLYIMLLCNSNPAPGSYDFDELVDFWTAVAPRYADETHVIYEMVNEPVDGPPPSYSDAVIADLKHVYNIMRSAASQTHIALWCFMGFGGADGVFQTLQKWPEVDYSSESVGFHWYSGTQDATVPAVKAQYPVFMTEVSKGPPDTNDVGVIAQCEDLGISWIHLSGRLAGQMAELETLIDELAQQGYIWAADKEETMATLVDGQSVTWEDLDPGIYEVTEAVLATWKLEPVEAAEPLPNGCRVVVNPGVAINLVFRNSQKGSITITKETDPSGSIQEFEITLTKIE